MVERALSQSRILNDLEAEIKLTQKKEEALASLLQSGRISQQTFELLQKRTSHLRSALAALKEILEKESSLVSECSEGIRILESLLVDFKLRHLLGEIGEEGWRQKSEIISLGLDSLKGKLPLDTRMDFEPTPPPQPSNEGRLTARFGDILDEGSDQVSAESPSGARNKPPVKKNARNRHLKGRHRKHAVKETSNLADSSSSEFHCMNPWKQNCRNTAIELSIYYQGQLTPICRECWEEISKKNIEWSGL